jgi:hypothetical protein
MLRCFSAAALIIAMTKTGKSRWPEWRSLTKEPRSGFMLGRAVAVLYIWILLRIYAWPLLGGDSPIDSKFWASRFLPAYQALEDKILELTRLVEPQSYEQLLVKTSRWRKN